MEARKIRVSRKMSVGEWLERTIHDLKHPSRLKPTSNYQVYVCLYNKLQLEGEIFNTPLLKVNDSSFRQLIKWMLKTRQGNFLGTLKTFTALINRANRSRLIKYKADFPYRDYAPKNKKEDNAREFLLKGGNISSLSLKQYHEFTDTDLSGIHLHGGPHVEYWKSVFFDFCVFLYELKSRPIDVLKLHADNFALDPLSQRTVCSYIPSKKRNQPVQSSRVVQFLSPKAEEIYRKYSGKSKAGYLFPFPMNRHRWNLDNPSEYHRHYQSARNLLWRMDTFLHQIGEKMNLPFPFTLYVIRRTAITHAIIENKIPLLILAKMAGTSVRMIERHYTNYLHTLSQY